MHSQVFFGSPRQARLDAKETLPAKLDLILDRLHLRDRVKGETVAIKMHTGNNIGYSTVHPVFVRKVVQAVKSGGGTPFVADVNWDVRGAEERGYSLETLGCPVYPAGGPDEKYFYRHERAVQEHPRMARGGDDPGRDVPDQPIARQRASELQLRWRIQEPGVGVHGGRHARARCTTPCISTATGSRTSARTRRRASVSWRFVRTAPS